MYGCVCVCIYNEIFKQNKNTDLLIETMSNRNSIANKTLYNTFDVDLFVNFVQTTLGNKFASFIAIKIIIRLIGCWPNAKQKIKQFSPKIFIGTHFLIIFIQEICSAGRSGEN